MFASGKTATVVSNAISYIEDVFSTYLYTGTGASQTITNGIDLAGKGGLTWIKQRTLTRDHNLFDTNRGATKSLFSDSTSGEITGTTTLTSFNSNGFSLGDDSDTFGVNLNSQTYASWTFRKQPKFFDVVTYTGDGTGGSRQVAHNLGSTPGCVLIKRTDASGEWMGFHRGTGATNSAYAELSINLTTAPVSGAAFSQSIVTSTYLVVGDIQSADGSVSANTNGATYVAYLFAHNAGGFGLTGTDNVISCGSFTTDGSGLATVNLGYEPQWVIAKNVTSVDSWLMVDNMRGFVSGAAVTTSDDARLFPNLSNAETINDFGRPTATGFEFNVGTTSKTYIYIAIRRGPMKVPTSGTSVFAPVAYTGTNVDNRLVDTGILTDMTMARIRTATSAGGFYTADRMRGNTSLATALGTDTENTDADSFMTPTVGYGGPFSAMNGFGVGNDVTRQLNQSSTSQLAYAFKRAPSFFDEVCYTGNGTAGATQTHNLGVVPEMMIVKARNYSGGRPWPIYHSGMGNTKFMYLNSTDAEATNPWWNDTTPTASVFTIGSNSVVNFSGTNYVAYLFATCAGVSKVGTYTGTGALQTINCGFTSSARFILIKRTNAIGDWWLYDSARGITSGNDPYILINTTAAEVTGYNYVATDSTGFQVTAAAADINTSGDTYIFLAIA